MVVDEKLVLVWLHMDFQLRDLRECKGFLPVFAQHVGEEHEVGKVNMLKLFQ